jgi:hypothetical protein
VSRHSWHHTHVTVTGRLGLRLAPDSPTPEGLTLVYAPRAVALGSSMAFRAAFSASVRCRPFSMSPFTWRM